MSSNGHVVTKPLDRLQQLEFSLQRLQLMLQRQLLRLRVQHHLVEHDWRGTFISDEQVDALGSQFWQNGAAEPPSVSALNTQIEMLTTAAQLDFDHPLAQLGKHFDLSPAEQDIILIALAGAVDSRFELFFAYVQNDVARKLPTVDLALKLLFSDFPERLAGQHLFAPDAPLRRYHLIKLANPIRQPHAPLLAQEICLDQAILDWLLGEKGLDPQLAPIATLTRAKRQPISLPFSEALLQQIERLSHLLAVPKARLGLSGPRGVGKVMVAQWLAAQLDRPLLEIVWSPKSSSGEEVRSLLWRIEREARLRQAVLLFVAPNLKPADLAPITQPLIWATRSSALFNEQQANLYHLQLPAPDFANRVTLWERFLPVGAKIEAESLHCLATQFRFNLSETEQAVSVAQRQAALAGEAHLTVNRLQRAARDSSDHAIGDLAQKVQNRLGWSDIILPKQSLRQLQEVFLSIKHRYTVYAQWGFAAKLSSGKGVSALFHGPSGTGKTMAASILANESGFDLYRIDLATVVSKYIGETEQNLSKIFAAAESSNAILFFDEADALFGKRSEVKDARDRYANLEVAYLLQRIEAYEGIVILATNLSNNMDDAFARRLHHTVEFQKPTVKIRQQIWRHAFPAGAPLHDEIDFSFLAQQFELSGGNIRNVALTAAFLAAEAETAITMEMIILGLARELQKMGKLPTPSSFGDYYPLLQADL